MNMPRIKDRPLAENKLNKQDYEESLIRRVVQGGDSEAFARLMAPYEKSVYAVLYSVLGGNEEDVLDARQEVLMAVFTSLKTSGVNPVSTPGCIVWPATGELTISESIRENLRYQKTWNQLRTLAAALKN
jgi:hypothetical protein